MFERYGIIVDFNFKATGNAAQQLRALITEMNKFPAAQRNVSNAIGKTLKQEINQTATNLKGSMVEMARMKQQLVGKEGLLNRLLYGQKTEGAAGLVRELRSARMQIQSEINKIQAALTKTAGTKTFGEAARLKGIRQLPAFANIQELKRLSGVFSTISDNALSTATNIGLARSGVDLLGRSTSNMNALFGRTAVAMLVFYRMNQLISTTISSFRTLEEQLASTQAILHDTPFFDQSALSNFTQLTEDVKKLGVAVGVSAEEVASSLDVVFQATDLSTRAALEIAQLSSETAKVTRSSVETIAEILVGARNAFNLSSKDMLDVSNKLIVLWDEGVVTLDELSSALGRVFQAGRLFGAQGTDDMAQLFTWTAAVTKESGSALRNLTYLQNVMQDLVRPAVRQKLIEQGIDFTRGDTRFEGNVGAVEQILERGAGFITSNFAKARTQRGFSVLLGEYERGYLDVGLERFTESDEYLRNAFAIVSDKLSHRLKRVETLVANINKSVGQDLVRSFISVADAILAINDALDKTEMSIVGKTVLGGTGRAVAETSLGYGGFTAGLMMLGMLTGQRATPRMGGTPFTRTGDRMSMLGSNIFGSGAYAQRLQQDIFMQNAMLQSANMSQFGRMQTLAGNEQLQPFFLSRGVTPTNLADVSAISPEVAGMRTGIGKGGRPYYQVPTPGAPGRYSFANKAQIQQFQFAQKASAPIQGVIAGAGAATALTRGLSTALGALGGVLLLAHGAGVIYNSWLDGVAKKAEFARRNLEDLTDQMVELIELPRRYGEAKTYATETNQQAGLRSFLASEIDLLPSNQREQFLKQEGLKVFDTDIGQQIGFEGLGLETFSLNQADEIIAALSAAQLATISEEYAKNAPVKVREDVRGMLSKGKFWTTFKGLHTGRDRDIREDLDPGVFDWLNKLVGEDVGLVAGLGATRVWHPDKQAELVKYLNDTFESIKAQAEAEEGIVETSEELRKKLEEMEEEFKRIEEGEIAKTWRTILFNAQKLDDEIEAQINWELELNELKEEDVDDRKKELIEQKKLPVLAKIRAGLASEDADIVQQILDQNEGFLSQLELEADIQSDINLKKLQRLEAEERMLRHIDKIEGYLTEFTSTIDARTGRGNRLFSQYGGAALSADQTYLGGASGLVEGLIGLYGPEAGNNLLQSAAGLGFQGLELQALRANLRRSEEAYNITTSGVYQGTTNQDLMVGLFDLGGAGSANQNSNIISVANVISDILNSGRTAPEAAQIIGLLLSNISGNKIGVTKAGADVFGLEAGFDPSFLSKLGLDPSLFTGGLQFTGETAQFLQGRGAEYTSLSQTGLGAMNEAFSNLQGASGLYSKGLLNNLMSVMAFATSKKRASFSRQEIDQLVAFETLLAPFLGQFGDIFGTLSEYQRLGEDESLLTGEFGRQVRQGQALVQTPEGQVLRDFLSAMQTAGVAPEKLFTGDVTDEQLGVLFSTLQETMMQTMLDHETKRLEDLETISDSVRNQVGIWESLEETAGKAEFILSLMPEVSQELMTNLEEFSAKIKAMGARLGVDIGVLPEYDPYLDSLAVPWVDSVLSGETPDMSLVNPADLLTGGGSSGVPDSRDLFGGKGTSTTKQMLARTKQTSGG